MVYLCNFPIIRFYFLFSCVTNKIEDYQRVLTRFPKSSTLHALLRGIGDALGDRVVDGVVLALSGGVDIEELPRLDIKCCQYL